MSGTDLVSNSGLYPALPIGDKRSSREGSQTPRREERPPEKSPPGAAVNADPASPRPPKSLIDEYA